MNIKRKRTKRTSVHHFCIKQIKERREHKTGRDLWKTRGCLIKYHSPLLIVAPLVKKKRKTKKKNPKNNQPTKCEVRLCNMIHKLILKQKSICGCIGEGYNVLCLKVWKYNNAADCLLKMKLHELNKLKFYGNYGTLSSVLKLYLAKSNGKC